MRLILLAAALLPACLQANDEWTTPAPAPASAGGAEPAWAVKDAPVRFKVRLLDAPSHPSAGYFIRLPDGGVLPGPFPDPAVYDEAGAPVRSAVLWLNRNAGFGLVFEAPKAGNGVVVYVTGAAKPRLWTPGTGLTPSAILCVSPGDSERQDAVRLAKLGTVGPTADIRNQAGVAARWKGESLGLVMGGWTESSGVASTHMRKDPFALYLLAYVNVVDPGATWVAPVTLGGRMDIAFDGKPLETVKRSEKRGGVGASVALTAGLHRLEVYGYGGEGGRPGPMMVAWRTPKTTVAELGGERTAGMRYPGTPMNEIRQLRPEEIVRSGNAEAQAIQSRDGAPLAFFSVTTESVFWFGDEEPLVQTMFRVMPGNAPEETRYEWQFDRVPGAVGQGAELEWLLKGGVDHWVTLVAEAGDKRSESRVPLFPFMTQPSSIANAGTRAAFRRACLNMLRAYPENGDPFAAWSPGLWNNFFRVLDAEPKSPLLDYIVVKRWDAFSKRVEGDRRALVEDLALMSLGVRNPDLALATVQQFAKDAQPRIRRAELQLAAAEIRMYYLKDLDGARTIIRPYLLESGDIGDLARLRMGDVEFLARNLNEATRYYGEVQGRAKHGVESQTPAVKAPEGDEAVKAGKPGRQAAPPAARQPVAPAGVAAWKKAAIRDVAAAENVANLLDQGFYLEAFQALRKWEREFPLSKISGDYCLQEARFYMAMENYHRPRAILTAYCDQVDASNVVPEALRMIVRCMTFLGAPDAEVDKYQKEIEKRLNTGVAE
jgi:hypothetical protein